jgi:hypothetical protein
VLQDGGESAPGGSAGTATAAVTGAVTERRSARTTAPGRRRARHAVRRLTTPALLGAAWAAASAAMLLRSAGLPPWRSIWAEDGTQFLLGAVRSPGPGTWLEPYAGYRHLVPRLVGDLAARFPIADASVVLAVTSSVVAGGALVLFAAGLRRRLPAAWMQAGLVLAVAATHATASESAANAANLHWYLTLGLVGLALLRPRRIATALAAAALAAAFALSDPFSPCVAALAMVDAACRTATARGLRAAAVTWPVALALSACAATQVLTMERYPRTPPSFAGPPHGDLPWLYLDRVLRDGLSPVPAAWLSDDALLLVVSAGAAVLLGLAVAAAGARRLGGHTALGVTLVAASPAMFVTDVLVNHTVADRYAAAPTGLLVGGLLVLAAGVPRVFHLACAGVVVLGLSSFATHPARGQGPGWVDELRRAAAECRAPGQVVPVRLAPATGDPPRWVVELPCDRIATGALDPPPP